MTLPVIQIASIDARVEAFDWSFPVDHADEIEAHWQKNAVGNPGIFNGKVLIQHRGTLDGDVFRTGYFVTDYKPFFAYLRLPYESPTVRNGFGMAALRARDGAFLLGEMAAGTANAGKIYFAAGTPDLGDIVDGKVDLAGSVARELCEETGLRADEVCIQNSWSIVFAPKRVAFFRPAVIDLPAVEAQRLMTERLKGLHEEELSRIIIIRPGDPILDDSRVPNFVVSYIRKAFAES